MERSRALPGLLVVATACGGVQQQADAGPDDPDAAIVDARIADGAGPPDAMPADRIVFVTRMAFNGNLGGLDGADLRCQGAAVAAGLPGTYRAWLSDSTGSPSTRMSRRDGTFRLTTGLVVATSWADLTDGTIVTRIDRDELGVLTTATFVCQGGEVWTNTTATGATRAATDCNDWGGIAMTSNAGNVGFIDVNWTESSCVSIGCGSTLPLYCVGQ